MSSSVSQEDLGSDWQPPYSLAGDAVSRAKIAAAPLPSTSDYHVLASLPLKEKEKKKVKSLNRVQLFAIPWMVAHQTPLSMEFSRQEYWSGLPFPSPKRAINVSWLALL